MSDVPFEVWTNNANKVIATARGYVRSITMLPLNEMCYPSTARKAVELANELLAVLEAADGDGMPEGMHQDNHIRVTLNFVPVWQGLPVDEDPFEANRIRRFVVMLTVHPYSSIAIKDEGEFYTLFGDRLEGVTHWAEIPTIEESER